MPWIWRCMVLDAFRQITPDQDDEGDFGFSDHSQDISVSAWEDVVDVLASAVLWDRDYELVDGFMDENPSAARHRKKLLGIHDNYFVEPPLDPTVSQTRLLLAQTRSLVARRAR